MAISSNKLVARTIVSLKKREKGKGGKGGGGVKLYEFIMYDVSQRSAYCNNQLRSWIQNFTINQFKFDIKISRYLLIGIKSLIHICQVLYSYYNYFQISSRLFIYFFVDIFKKVKSLVIIKVQSVNSSIIYYKKLRSSNNITLPKECDNARVQPRRNLQSSPS